MQEKGKSSLDMPVGWRFLPSDEDLVLYYLYNRVMGNGLPCYDIVRESDLYGDKDPWELFGDVEEDRDLYFFTHLKKKPNGSRIERRVGTDGGTWHGEDAGMKSTSETTNGEKVSWTKKRFRYENPKCRSQNGSWLMEEYRIGEGLMVLCRIKKNKGKRRCNGLKREREIVCDDDQIQGNGKRLKKREETTQKRQENIIVGEVVDNLENLEDGLALTPEFEEAFIIYDDISFSIDDLLAYDESCILLDQTQSDHLLLQQVQ